jgi:NADH-quinone oxidoreductase subunit C
MTKALAGEEVARRISEGVPGSVVRHSMTDVWINPESVLEVCRFLKEAPDLDFAFLTSISAVDYIEHFEVVYHLLSMRRNHSAVLKTQVYGRDEPSLPSVVSLWQGADLQEREVWDLMGIRFEGHPNMKRILLWEGFPGHPLRKDFLGN